MLSQIARVTLPRRVVEESIRNVYGDPARVTPELIERYFVLTLRDGNRAALAERLKQVPIDDIAGSRLQIFEDLGHVPHEEDPARTVSAAIAFLGEKMSR